MYFIRQQVLLSGLTTSYANNKINSSHYFLFPDNFHEYVVTTSISSRSFPYQSHITKISSQFSPSPLISRKNRKFQIRSEQRSTNDSLSTISKGPASGMDDRLNFCIALATIVVVHVPSLLNVSSGRGDSRLKLVYRGVYRHKCC